MPRQSQELMEKYGFPSTSTLLDVCEAVHGHIVGHSDPMSDEVLERCMEILETALVHWTPTPIERHRLFDNAVQRLIEATYYEHMVWAGQKAAKLIGERSEDAKV